MWHAHYLLFIEGTIPYWGVENNEFKLHNKISMEAIKFILYFPKVKCIII